jgi:hypothetical protein
MHRFHKFISSWNSTCFWQFLCPSSGVYSLYTQQCYMSYSFRSGPGWNCSSILVLLESCLQTCMTYPLPIVQWINCWWWTYELSEIGRVSGQNKFVKLVHLVGFIIKENVAPLFASMSVTCISYRLVLLNVGAINLRLYQPKRTGSWWIYSAVRCDTMLTSKQLLSLSALLWESHILNACT